MLIAFHRPKGAFVCLESRSVLAAEAPKVKSFSDTVGVGDVHTAECIVSVLSSAAFSPQQGLDSALNLARRVSDTGSYKMESGSV